MKILITGAGSGIGYLTALTLAEMGNLVYLTCHTSNQVKNVKHKIKDNKNIIVIKLDIKNEKDVNFVLKLDIDCLISNASVCYGGSLIEFNINDMRENFEVNVFSNFELIKKYMIKFLDNNKKLRIVIISSIAASIPILFGSVYSATKSSVSAITVTLQKEIKLINSNIEIILIEPGLYHTGFNNILFDSKYNNGKYFVNIKNKLYKYEHTFLNLFEKKKLDSIVVKIVRAATDKKPKKVYRSPFIQSFLSKLYLIFRR